MTAERESTSTGLNESPHPKAGKSVLMTTREAVHPCLNESPRPKTGKLRQVDRLIDLTLLPQ